MEARTAEVDSNEEAVERKAIPLYPSPLTLPSFICGAAKPRPSRTDLERRPRVPIVA